MALDFNNVILVTLFIKPVKFRDPIDNSTQEGFSIENRAIFRFNDGSEVVAPIPIGPGEFRAGFIGSDTHDQAATVFRFQAAGPAFDGSNPPNFSGSGTI